MKKILIFACLAFFLVSCGSRETVGTPEVDQKLGVSETGSKNGNQLTQDETNIIESLLLEEE